MESLVNQGNGDAQPATDMGGAGADAEYVPEEEAKKPEVLQVNMPLDFLLNANRGQKREFFKNMVKNINARVEMIRQQRRAEG